MVSVWFHLVAEIEKIFVGFHSVSSLWICWVHSPTSPTLHPGTGDGATVGGVGGRRVCSDIDDARTLSLSLSL